MTWRRVLFVEYADVIDLNRLGGWLPRPFAGNPVLETNPRMAETEAGIIQSIGLLGKE